MSKGFWAIIAAIVIIFGGILFFKSNNTSAPGSANQLTNHVEGQNQKKVSLVEYGDYQCPICGYYYPVVKQVVADHKADIQFQFRNLPLTEVHQNAFAAGRAAEAAGLQNKYWEMHDLLYENQTAWSEASVPQNFFNQFAQQLGLNVEQFKKDFASTRVSNLITADRNYFVKNFVQDPNKDIATPTFFLDGQKVKPALSYTADNKSIDIPASVATFSKLIDEAIAKKSPTQPAQ